ncbi:acryloyl-CoA reductase [Nonomuraea sp. NPDC049028]|uniref:acrylyl-CoA reductase family protein n=1 Tax=Nonomuraea sp. NPDC049028 TaxID=3364348 RepID=UPI003715A88F
MIPEEPFPAWLVEHGADGTRQTLISMSPGELPDGAVTIRVTWSAVNYKDALATVANSNITNLRRLVPGIDLAGTVVASDDDKFSIGDEVLVTGFGLGVSQHGGWARYARVPADWVLPLPDGLSTRQAMILGTAGLTAGLSIHALERHGLTPNSGPVLVLGATGGVGSIAIGALAAAGYHVSAVTGKADQAKYLAALGASEIIDREILVQAADRPLGKTRWAACVDPIGGPGTGYALRSLLYGGAVALSGLTAGTSLHSTVMPFILRGVSLIGIDSVQAGLDLRRQIWSRLATDLRPVGLDECIAHEIPLTHVGQAAGTLLEGGALGRFLVDLVGAH